MKHSGYYSKLKPLAGFENVNLFEMWDAISSQ